MDHCCKVGRVVDAYDLQRGVGGDGLDAQLLARWLGRQEYSATGLRPLKDWVNTQLLKAVYRDHDRNTLGNRLQSDYDALTGDEADLALLDDLAADGIDGEQLQSDFLSTSTLYRHFTECLGESKSKQSTAGRSGDWEADKVDYARDIVERNVSESLRSLENKGRIPGAATADIKTEIVLGCPECATQVSFERALARGYVCREHMGGGADADGSE
jgi:hypothetical protein